MSGQPIHFVDAFTDRPFSGNPAAVCILDSEVSDEWMQKLAGEINLSETAFIRRNGRDSAQDAPEPLPLRWFTPTTEVELCGHATLASAHILWESGGVASNVPIRFATLSGILTVTRSGDWIDMDFPAAPPVEQEVPAGLLDALGLTGAPRFFGQTRFDYFLEVESERAVRAMSPHFDRLRGFSSRGVIVTSRSDDYDFVSRFFAPAAGVNEDPVTGSAHASLSPYWTAKLERSELLGYQASARGGLVRVRSAGERVIISGRAVTTMRAELAIPLVP